MGKTYATGQVIEEADTNGWAQLVDLAASGGATLVGFSASNSASGTVARALVDRGICVTDAPFNADPTGVADSTAAIQAAIDSGGSNRTIVVPYGTFLAHGINLNGTSGTLTGVTLLGLGWGSILKCPNATTANIVQATSGSNCRVLNLCLDGNAANNPAGTNYLTQNCVMFYGVTGGEISGCLIKNAPLVGIVPGAPTLTQSGSSNIIIRGNYITGCSSGIAAMKQSNNTISGNVLLSNTSYGCVLDQQSTQCSVTGNTSVGNGNNGIYAYNGTTHAISGNVCAYNGQVGIALDNASAECSVTGNACTHNTNSGITLTGATTACSIASNTCAANGQYGIEDNASGGNTIQGNHCYANTYSGIGITNGSLNWVVSSNFCSSNKGSGIIALSNQGLIKANYCLDNNQAAGASDGGIRISSAAGVMVQGNTCLDDQGTKTQNWGVVSDGTASANIIMGNNVQANKTAGMSLVGTNTVRNNIGWATEAQGSASIASGATSVTVSHGLAETPQDGAISVVAASSLSGITNFWATNITATTFDIVANAAPTATVYFWWKAANL